MSMSDVNCPIYCFGCAKEIKSSVVILNKKDYERIRLFGVTSGCVCETEDGQIVELCCAHDEYYKKQLSKLKAIYERYKHLDVPLSDEYIDSSDDFPGHIRRELWMAVREILKETP